MNGGDRRPGPLTRRQLFGGVAGLAVAGASGPAAARVLPAPRRVLSLVSLHTGERTSTCYWRDGRYDPEALARIDHLLRDHRTNDVTRIDVRLLDLLVALRRTLDSDSPFHVISGYRSPRTNQALATKGRGVARKSLHMQGMAIDIRLPGRDLDGLWRAARSLKLGGVGHYPKSGFIHVDVGRVRYW